MRLLATGIWFTDCTALPAKDLTLLPEGTKALAEVEKVAAIAKRATVFLVKRT
jgi:hypothetical protein